MNIMFRPQDKYEQVNLLGIAVSKGTHTAFLYIKEDDDDDKPYLMHLNGYNKLLNDIPHDQYVWVDLPISESQKQNIIDYIEKVYVNSRGKIPYDIASQAFFKLDGSLIKKDEFGGLTCATFVLSVFECLGHHLIDHNTWPRTQTNQEDIKRWLPIVSILAAVIFKAKRHEYKRRILKFFKGDLRRYRAEEVAAAGGKIGFPHSYNDIKHESIEILNKLNSVY